MIDIWFGTSTPSRRSSYCRPIATSSDAATAALGSRARVDELRRGAPTLGDGQIGHDRVVVGQVVLTHHVEVAVVALHLWRPHPAGTTGPDEDDVAVAEPDEVLGGLASHPDVVHAEGGDALHPAADEGHGVPEAAEHRDLVADQGQGQHDRRVDPLAQELCLEAGPLRRQRVARARGDRGLLEAG